MRDEEGFEVDEPDEVEDAELGFGFETTLGGGESSSLISM